MTRRGSGRRPPVPGGFGQCRPASGRSVAAPRRLRCRRRAPLGRRGAGPTGRTTSATARSWPSATAAATGGGSATARRGRSRTTSPAGSPRGAGRDERVLIVTGNSLAHALLTFGAAVAGVPVCPVSAQYALSTERRVRATAARDRGAEARRSSSPRWWRRSSERSERCCRWALTVVCTRPGELARSGRLVRRARSSAGGRPGRARRGERAGPAAAVHAHLRLDRPAEDRGADQRDVVQPVRRARTRCWRRRPAGRSGPWTGCRGATWPDSAC